MRDFISLLSPALLAAILSLTSSAGNYASSGGQKDILSRPVAMGDMPNAAFSVFQGAMVVAGVPGGESFLEGCANQPAPKLRPEGKTLGEVLDNIIHGVPSYVWKMDAGVVNLEPSRGIPALLTLRLRSYDSQKLTDAVSAVTFLSSSPEVVQAAEKLGLGHNVSGAGLGVLSPGPQLPKKPLNIHLQNVTLLEALNAIARANRKGVWVYRETDCESVRQYEITFVE